MVRNPYAQSNWLLANHIHQMMIFTTVTPMIQFIFKHPLLYDVIIELNSCDLRIGKYLHAIKPPCSVMIVTDDNVGPLYASHY